MTHEGQLYSFNIGPTEKVLVDGSVHLSSALTPGGRYLLRCMETAVYLRQGGAGLTVTSSDRKLAAGKARYINVDDGDSSRVAVMTASGTGGFLCLTRVDDLVGSAARHKALSFAAFSGVTEAVAVGAGSLSSSGLVHGGRYVLVCDDTYFYIRQGDSGVTATADDCPVPAGEEVAFNVDDDSNDYIAVITDSGATGTLRITRVDSV